MVSKNTKAKKRAAVGESTGTNGSGSPTSRLNSENGEPIASTSSPSSPLDKPPTVSDPTPDKAKDSEKVKEQGNVAFKAGKYQEAIDLYTQAIDLNPNEPAYYTNRAAAYMALKKFKPALADCQQAATIQSSSPAAKTLFRLAKCQLALGNPPLALSTLSTVLSIDPGNVPAKQAKKAAEDLQGHLGNFERSRNKKDWGMARLALDKCFQGVESQSSDVPTEWRIWRIELEVARGNWEQAAIAANDALRLEPNSPEVLYQRGLVLFLTGKLSQALAHVSSALRLDPGHKPSQDLRKRTKDVERLKDEGNALFKAGKWEEALEKYTEGLEKVEERDEEGKGGPIRATLLSNRATTLLKLNQPDNALVEIDSSLFLVPSSFKALRTRARIHLQLEKFESAVQDFKAALQNAETESDRKAVQGELKKAEVDLKRSKSKDYYKILGLQKDCTDSEIKKAYRKESLKHHPDKGGDEEKFKLVVEAHAVLSDSERRRRYDLGEDEDGMNDGSGGGFPGGAFQMNPADLAEIFSQFSAGGQRHHGHGGGFSSGSFSGGAFRGF